MTVSIWAMNSPNDNRETKNPHELKGGFFCFHENPPGRPQPGQDGLQAPRRAKGYINALKNAGNCFILAVD